MKRTLLAILLAVAGFGAGLGLFGMYRIPKGRTGVRIALWGSERFVVLEPGIHFVWPMLGRIRVFKERDRLRFYNYADPDPIHGKGFFQQRAVVAHAQDGPRVFFSTIVHYRVDHKTMRSMIERFNGRWPREIVSFEARGALMDMIGERPSSFFADGEAAMQEFRERAPERIWKRLAAKGIGIEDVVLTFDQVAPPRIEEK